MPKVAGTFANAIPTGAAPLTRLNGPQTRIHQAGTNGSAILIIRIRSEGWEARHKSAVMILAADILRISSGAKRPN